MPKNIIFSSINETLALILKNKSLFILLFILQIIFLAVFFSINLIYQIKILQSAKVITDYLSEQKLDEVSVSSNILQQKNILGNDPLLISRKYNEIVKNFRLYLIYIFILIIVFVSIAWSITHKLIYKINFKQLIKIFLKIFVVSLFYFGLIFLFFFSLFNISFTEFTAESIKLSTKYVPLFIFSIALTYFMFVSLSLTNKTELKNIVQKTLRIGIKKIHYILAVYFINILLFGISVFLLYYFIERNLFILLSSIILMFFSFVFGRVFVVKVVEKLDV